MSLSVELLELYREWHRFTAAETRAIEARAWEQVEQIQSAKASLQPAILSASLAIDRRASLASEKSGDIGELLAELIHLEQANSEKMTSQLSAAHAERSALGRSASQLRGIRRAYVRPKV
jgi:hypothetical protein